MFETHSKFEISAKDGEVIEAALQTQLKILRLQAGAGSAHARARLNDVKRALAKFEAQRPVARTACKKPSLRGFLGLAT